MAKFIKTFETEEERDAFLKSNSKSTTPMILWTAGSAVKYGSTAELNNPFIKLTVDVSDVTVDVPVINHISTYALLGVTADGTKRVLRDNCIRFRKSGKHVVQIYLKSKDYYKGLSFKGCGNIVKVEFLKDVDSINKGMFERCYNLSEINIPSGVKTINDSAFYGCKDLKSVTLHEGLINIGEESFFMSGLSGKLEIPSTVETIGNYAFFKCDNVSSVVFKGNNFKSIGKKAFNNDIELPEINIASED